MKESIMKTDAIPYFDPETINIISSETLYFQNLKLDLTYNVKNDFKRLIKCQEFNNVLRHFNNRILKTKRSYLYLRYYYDKGIPDRRWHDGRGNYFPDFTNEDHLTKLHFDSFSEAFYHDYFTVWEYLLQVINVFYNFKLPSDGKLSLEINQQLEDKNKQLLEVLTKTRGKTGYKNAKKLRNDIAHNFPHGAVTGTTVQTESYIGMGTGSYITSSEILDNIHKALEILQEALPKIEQSINNNKS